MDLSAEESLTLTLHDIGAVRFGSFVLHSGRKSSIYLDLRLLVSFPDALRQATAAYQEMLAPLSYDLLAATPLAGLPIGTALSLATNKPLVYPRKTPKGHGTGKMIEGAWEVGQTAIVVDDLITTGDSLLQMIASLKAAGLQVSDAVILVDREQGGRAMLEEEGYRLHSILTLSRLLDILEEQGRITAKQRSDALSSIKKQGESP
jgi:uridine monophosphate synthetase